MDGKRGVPTERRLASQALATQEMIEWIVQLADPPRRRRLRWLLEAAVFAVAFVGLQSWLTRDVAPGPLPVLEGTLVDGARMTSRCSGAPPRAIVRS